MNLLDRILDPFRGRAITIPPYDGAWRPNTALDTARPVAALPGADNLCADGAGVVWLSAGPELLRLEGDAPVAVARYGAEITALCAGADGALLVALDDGGLFLRRGDAQEDVRGLLPRRVSVTAAMADGAGFLLAEGSASHAASDWPRALMARAGDGALWHIDPGAGRAERVAGGLAFPAGLARTAQGAPVVAEAFAHRIATPDGSRPLLERIPGYPGRLSPAAGDGWWLAVFAPRNRLIELVLREDRYRADMVAQVPPEYWIAPALHSGASFLEPLQRGGVRTMGVRKPWAPSRSYGLVALLDAGLRPQASFHSRADGQRHGATAVLDHAGRRLIALKGAGEVIELTGDLP
ncbi:MAG: hypothetical protein H3C51_03185 [Rubellimicrobium sp.]|nr:hypothetical protein [Rubellimicrobium sp.]